MCHDSAVVSSILDSPALREMIVAQVVYNLISIIAIAVLTINLLVGTYRISLTY